MKITFYGKRQDDGSVPEAEHESPAIPRVGEYVTFEGGAGWQASGRVHSVDYVWNTRREHPQIIVRTE